VADVDSDARVAELLRIMGAMDALRQAAEAAGCTVLRSEVIVTYVCERCGSRFEDGDACDNHEPACSGDGTWILNGR
jgi:hypothetical protein